MSRTRPSTTLFHDEVSRRQWESSIGIVHGTAKAAKDSSQLTRLYTNPLKEKADNKHRPVSPLLNLDPDRMNIDEYADVAGHFFSDVMPVSVHSRAGKRPISKSRSEINALKRDIMTERIYAQPSCLPRLKGCKQVRTKLQNETLNAYFDSEKMKKYSASRTASPSSGGTKQDSVAFDQKSLFENDIATYLTRFDHSAYVMIPGKLYKYEDTIDSCQLKETSVADMLIPHNAALVRLKVSIIEILFGKSILEKKEFQKTLKHLRIWVFESKQLKWAEVMVDREWTHSKLLAQERSESLRIMYSLRISPRPRSSLQQGGSMNDSSSATITSEDLTRLTDDDHSLVSGDVCVIPSIGEQETVHTMMDTNFRRRIDCHTPTPSLLRASSSLLLLKNDDVASNSSSYVDEIPKTQCMANILESRLMKSRYC